MIKSHRLSDAQAAVLGGKIEFNANGSMAVTTGRENTLASLRKLGLLHGNLLTVHGNDARVSVQAGDRKILVREDGRSDTFYLPQVEPVRADWETAPLPATVAPTMCQDCLKRPATIFDTDAPMCAECAGDVPVKLSRPMQTNGDSIPYGAQHVWTHSADWTRGMNHGAFKLYRLDEADVYGPELADGVKWFATAEFSGSTPTLLYAGYSQGDAMMACARAHWAHARTVARNTETVPGVRVASITHGEVTVNHLGIFGQHGALMEETAETVHVIEWSTGATETLCGEPIRQASGILRVNVDPTGATCAQCTVKVRLLEALDAVQPDDDDADHAAALSAALEAAERHLTPAQATAARVHGFDPSRVLPGGVVEIPGLEGVTVPLPPVLTVAPGERGKVVATVGRASRTFNDTPAARLHVSMWAHGVGYGPAVGRKLKWTPEGDTFVAPVRLI